MFIPQKLARRIRTIACAVAMAVTCAVVQGSDFVSAAPMSAQRSAHTMTLLSNGKVLVTGGYAAAANGAPMNTVELYDPATNTWSAVASLIAARASHTATLLQSGKVLVAGGVGPNNSVLISTEIYDPVTNKWTSSGNFSASPRTDHTATLLVSGLVLIVGGNDGKSGSLNSSEVYDPNATGPSWSFAGNLLTARDRHAATLLASGKVLVAGGNNSTTGPLSSAEIFNPFASNGPNWSAAGNLSAARYYLTATTLRNGTVLFAGGFDGAMYFANADLYNPTANTISPVASLNQARDLHTATLVPSGQVLVVGGQIIGTPVPSAELYDPAANTWVTAGTMLAARFAHAAVLMNNGKVLVSGGLDSTGVELNSAELYDAVITFFTSSQNPAFFGSPVTFSFAAADASVTSLTYSLNFGDATPSATGTFASGATVNVAHTFNPGSDSYLVTLTVGAAAGAVKETLLQNVPQPASGGTPGDNISTNTDPVTNPLDGLSISVTGSIGGVIQLNIDVSSLTRADYDVTTIWGDVSGRAATIRGTQPVHQFTHHGVYVAEVIATNRATGAMAGHGRKTLAISTKETGEQTPSGSAIELGARAPIAPAKPLIATQSVNGQFMFNGQASDSVNIRGAFQMPAGIDPKTPQEISLGVGNVVSMTMVNRRGIGSVPGTLPVLKALRIVYPKVKKGALTTGKEKATLIATFSAKGLSDAGFDTEGITNANPLAQSAVRTIQVAMVFNGVSYEVLVPVTFSLTQQATSGKVKGPVKLP